MSVPDTAASGSGLYHERQSWQLCALHTLNNLLQCRAFSKQDLDIICQELSPNQLINPHKSIFSTGNYDVNVITAALQKKGYVLVWFNKKRKLDTLKFEKVFGFIVNIISKMDLGLFSVASLFDSRHWYALRALEVSQEKDTKATLRHENEESETATSQQSDALLTGKAADSVTNGVVQSTGNNNENKHTPGVAQARWYNLDSKLRAPKVIGSDSDVHAFIQNVLDTESSAQILIVVTHQVAQEESWHSQAYDNC